LEEIKMAYSDPTSQRELDVDKAFNRRKRAQQALDLRPRYYAEQVGDTWVATDGMSRVYAYSGPYRREAELSAQLANENLAMNAKTDEERRHFLGS
jgi:hypothetical protein